MALNKKIRGLTVEIGGDTSKLGKSLDDSKKKSKNLTTELREVEKLLKMDPKNVELVAQKQKILTEQVGETKKRLELLKGEQEEVNKLYQNGKIGEEDYRAFQRQVEFAKQDLEKFEKQLDTTTEAFDTMQRKSGEINFSNAENKVDHFKGKVKDMVDTSLEKMDKLSEGFDKAGDNLGKVGSVLNIGSAAAAGTLVAGTKFAMNFEDAMAKVSTIADETEVPIEKLREQILELSNETGYEATEIANNVYDAISAGQSTADAVNFVRKSLSLSKAGFADAGSSLDILTTIMNAYGMEAEKVDDVSDMLIQTQNLGKVTVAQLASSMGKVIPTANSYSVKLDQIAAAYSITTASGVAAAESTTYINSMLNELGKSGTKVSDTLKQKTGKSFKELMEEGYTLSDVLKIISDSANKGVNYFDDVSSAIKNGTGMSFEELKAKGYDMAKMLELVEEKSDGNTRNFNAINEALKNGTGKTFKTLAEEGYTLDEVLDLVNETSAESKGSFNDMWSSAEAAKAGVILLGDSADDFNTRLGEMNDSAGATETAMGKLETTSDNTKKIINELKNAGIELGDEVLEQAAPILQDIMGSVKDFTAWLKKLSDEEKKNLTRAIEIVAVIGPAVTIVGKLTKGVGSAIGIASKAVKKIKSTTLAQQGLNAAFEANPIGVITLAVGGLIAAYISLKAAADNYMEQQWGKSEAKKFVDEVDAAADTLKTASEKIVDTTKNTIEGLDETFANNALIDTYQGRLSELLGKAELLPEEQTELENIVKYLSDNVQGFEDTWNKYTEKSGDGKIKLTADLETVQDAIDKTIDDYQRLATAAALSDYSSEITEEILKAGMDIDETKSKRANLQEQLEKKLKNKGLTEKDILRIEKQVENSFAKGEYGKWNPFTGDPYEGLNPEEYQEFKKIIDSLRNYDSELTDLGVQLEKSEELNKDLIDLQTVLNGNYDDAAAVLMAYNKKLISLDDIKGSRWKNLKNLEKAARESGKNTVLGVGKDLSEIDRQIQNGEISLEDAFQNRLFIFNKNASDIGDKTASTLEETGEEIVWKVEETKARAGAAASGVEIGQHYAKAAKRATKAVEDETPNTETASEKMATDSQNAADIDGWDELGSGWADDTKSGIQNKEQDVEDEAKNLAKKAKDGANKISLFETGKNFVSGFINGIKDGTLLDNLWDAAKNIGSTALNAIKKFLGIQSPSKEAYKVGDFFNQGFINGIKEGNPKALEMSRKLAETARKGLAEYGDFLDINVPSELPQSRILTDYTISHTFEQAQETRVLSQKMDKVISGLDKLNRNSQHDIILDGDTLVGRTIEKYDSALANLENQRNRGL